MFLRWKFVSICGTTNHAKFIHCVRWLSELEVSTVCRSLLAFPFVEVALRRLWMGRGWQTGNGIYIYVYSSIEAHKLKSIGKQISEGDAWKTNYYGGGFWMKRFRFCCSNQYIISIVSDSNWKGLRTLRSMQMWTKPKNIHIFSLYICLYNKWATAKDSCYRAFQQVKKVLSPKKRLPQALCCRLQVVYMSVSENTGNITIIRWTCV